MSNLAKFNGMIEKGEPYQFCGWELSETSLHAVFSKEGHEDQRLMAQAVRDHYNGDVNLRVASLVQTQNGDIIDLFPKAELLEAIKTYDAAKTKLLGSKEDFGALYMTGWTSEAKPLDFNAA